MKYPIDVRASGVVSLGPDVSCDGFLLSAKLRVQTHVHQDHMRDFHTSKGYQDILLSRPTRDLLISEFNFDLPSRINIRALNPLEPYVFGSSSVQLMPNDHILGSVQVQVELGDGMRVGYSGDFAWPLDDVIQVDGLVVDSTYGSPYSIRNYSQGDCEAQFVMLCRQLLSKGPVYVKAHTGTLHRAMQLLSAEPDAPLVGSSRLCDELDVYRQYGYAIGPVESWETPEGQALLKESRFIRLFGKGDKYPVDTGRASHIVLSAYFTRPDQAVVEYSPNSYAVALSNHADFHGTLEYIQATGAKYIVTDNTRGPNGDTLATEIQSRLGLAARPSSNLMSLAWGG